MKHWLGIYLKRHTQSNTLRTSQKRCQQIAKQVVPTHTSRSFTIQTQLLPTTIIHKMGCCRSTSLLDPDEFVREYRYVNWMTVCASMCVSTKVTNSLAFMTSMEVSGGSCDPLTLNEFLQLPY